MRCGFLWLAAAGAALLCGRPGLLLPLLAYILALLVFGLVLKVLPGRNWQGLLCLFLLVQVGRYLHPGVQPPAAATKVVRLVRRT